MGLFLTKSEVDRDRVEIDEEFRSVIKHPWFSGRKNARQWAFLRHCFAVLTGEMMGDFPCTEKQAVQYKYEINDRLQRYYLAFGKPVMFVFRLMSEKKDGLSKNEDRDYPSCNGYRLMVSYNRDSPDTIHERRLLLEKAIADAGDVEFDAYRRLPDIEASRLENVFDKTGKRFMEILNLLRKHKSRGWTLGNDMNPSTRRLIDVKIKEISETSAEARTSEYWLLMWWSSREGRYVHTYKEENKQTYLFSWKNDRWLVTENRWEKPKTSTPRRNIRAGRNKAP
jgi:hypothetical protein